MKLTIECESGKDPSRYIFGKEFSSYDGGKIWSVEVADLADLISMSGNAGHGIRLDGVALGKSDKPHLVLLDGPAENPGRHQCASCGYHFDGDDISEFHPQPHIDKNPPVWLCKYCARTFAGNAAWAKPIDPTYQPNALFSTVAQFGVQILRALENKPVLDEADD